MQSAIPRTSVLRTIATTAPWGAPGLYTRSRSLEIS